MSWCKTLIGVALDGDISKKRGITSIATHVKSNRPMTDTEEKETETVSAIQKHPCDRRRTNAKSQFDRRAALGPEQHFLTAATSAEERAKRCISISCKLLVSHIITTTMRSGFPRSLMWWLLNVGAAVALVTVSEALSLRI